MIILFSINKSQKYFSSKRRESTELQFTSIAAHWAYSSQKKKTVILTNTLQKV